MGGRNADLNLIIAAMPSNEISIAGAAMPNKLDRLIATLLLLASAAYCPVAGGYYLDGDIRVTCRLVIGMRSTHAPPCLSQIVHSQMG